MIKRHADDVLILAGVGLVIYATYLLSWIAALYVAGFFFIAVGIAVGIGGRKR